MATNERKDTQKRVDALKAEQQIQANLSAILQKNLDGRTKEGKILKENTASILQATSLEGKLTEIAKAKEKVINDIWDTNRDLAETMLEQLETAEKLTKTEKGRKDATDAIKDAGKDIAKDLGGAFGVSSQLVDALIAGGIAAAAFVVLKEIASYIGEGIKRMKEFNKETGASVSSMLEMEGGLMAARAEAGMMKYSMDEIRASSDAVRKSTGQIVVDPSLLADITEVNSVLKDADKAQSLTRTLKNAGQDAGELTKEIKDMADGMNMDAGAAMEYLADNQLALRGLTHDQIKARAEEALTVKKMGVDLAKAKQLASESLDIEKSMKDEMKLRMITGKNINMNALRAAQASGDAAAVAREQKKLIDSVGGSLNGNLQLQRMIGDATGLATEDMLNIQNATAEQAVEMAKGADATKDSSESLKSMQGFGSMVLKVLLGIGAGLLAIAAASFIFKKMSSGDGKNPVSKFIGDFGATDVLKGALAMLLISASMFVMAKAISAMPTEIKPYLGMAVGLGLMLGALYLLAKFPTADLLKGALALAVVGVSLIPFAYAMNLIGDISIGAILAVAAGILIFTGIILGLGMIMFSGVGALIFGAGVLALLALGAAMIVLGAGIVIFNKGVSGLGDNISIFVESISELLNIAPMLLGAVIPLVAFGLAMIPFGFGLLIASPGILLFGLALTTVAAAMNLFGVGIETFSKGISGIGEGIGIFAEKLSSFVLIAPSLLVASIALAAFGLSMIPLGIGLLFATPGVLLFGLALTTVALAMNLFGVGIDKFSSGISGIGDSIGTFTEKLKDLVSLAPMLLVSATSLGIFGLSLIPFGIGLLFATPPMLMFGLAMIPFAAGINLLNGLLPTFVDNITKLVEQSPNLIAISSAFMMFSGALITTTAAMIPFFPTFALTTLGMLALVPAMLLSSVATTTWSLSLTSLSNSIERLMPNLTAFLGVMPMMSAMIMLVPGLIALSASFIMLSASLVALSGGLAIVTLLLPTLFALAFALPLITAAFGGGSSGGSSGSDGQDGSSEESSDTSEFDMTEVVDAIKGLRQDIQNQPIMINVDGKVVSEITKVQSRKLSTRSAGYFGG